MTTVKGPYDPVKAVEGMFNGSVTRIAYALKDPAGYSGSTKTVLCECAKRFHDALDDCEIQLLDAKWFLEHQLRTNRLRREAQARELGTATKRKHSEIDDVNETAAAEKGTTKKAKVELTREEKHPKDGPQTKEPIVESKVELNTGPSALKVAEQPQKLKIEKNEKQQRDHLTKTELSAQSTLPPEPAKEQQSQPAADDFAKPTPQASPTGTDDGFNFESMFGDTANDAMEDPNKDNIDLDFDFTTGDFGVDKDEDEGLEAPSLDTLLPGLESYANQADDNILTAANPGMNTNTINNTSNSTAQDADALPSFANDFGKPNPEGPNIFDVFFNDDGLPDGSGGNFVDNIDLSDSALPGPDFESF